MFTIQQIKAIHSKVKSGADFPAYVQALKAIGLYHYDLYVKDGHAIYYGEGGFKLEGTPGYADKKVAEPRDIEKLQHALKIHQQGQTDYLTFCDQAAAAGVEKWATYVVEMKVIYYDRQGNSMIEEKIPMP